MLRSGRSDESAASSTGTRYTKRSATLFVSVELNETRTGFQRRRDVRRPLPNSLFLIQSGSASIRFTRKRGAPPTVRGPAVLSYWRRYRRRRLVTAFSDPTFSVFSRLIANDHGSTNVR